MKILEILFVTVVTLASNTPNIYVASDEYPNQSFLTILKRKECNYNPLSILEVGENTGSWSMRGKETFLKNSTFFLLEYNQLHISVLKTYSLPFELLPKRNRQDYYSIDRILHHRGALNYEMIKVDIAKINSIFLNSLQETLKTIEVILSQQSITDYNSWKSSPEFFSVHIHLESLGYLLYDISQGVINDIDVMDILWVKAQSKLWTPPCTGVPKLLNKVKL